MQRVIHLHVDAPAKPAEGSTCNGCGVCCAFEPCPIGQLVSRRRSGACSALLWDETARRYLCGLLAAPATYLPAGLVFSAPLVARWARRMIAAGIGCDSSVSVALEGD